MAGLTLPEPARSLFRKTRPILDRHVTRITPGRTGFALGGGTLLAARWNHRRSTDLDIFIHPDTELALLSKSRDPAFWKAMYDAGATDIELHRDFATPTIRFPDGRIELILGRPTPRLGQYTTDVEASETTVLSAAQILTAKLVGRGLRPPVRDLYDVAVADIADRAALTIAVNAMPDRMFTTTASSWLARSDLYQKDAAEQILGVPDDYEPVRSQLARRAADAARAVRYTDISITVSTNCVVVAATNPNGRQQRTYDTIDEIRNGFERDGINAALKARGWNPNRVRQDINNALSVKARRTVLDIESESPPDQGSRHESRGPDPRRGDPSR